MKPGPKPNIERDKMVMILRDENKLTFRQIAKMVDEDVKNVYVRYKRAKKVVGELST